MSEFDSEYRRDGQGRVWQLLRPPFRNWREEEVVIATTGWEQDGVVRRDLHIPLAQWLSWELVDAADAPEQPPEPGPPPAHTNLYELARRATTAVEAIGGAIADNLDAEAGPPDPRREPIDPWLLNVLCDELATCIEQLSFPLDSLADRADWLADAWEQDRGGLLEDGEQRPMVLQLQRGAATLRRAAALAGGAAAAAMQPGLEGLVEDLEVRLAVPDSDPTRWVDVLQAWGESGYRVRDASLGGPPLHERPVERADAPQYLAAAIAEVAGISLDSVGGERVAVDLAHEAHRRLEAMTRDRDQAYRHSPSSRLPDEPAPEAPPPLQLRAPEVLTAAVEDLADREGRRYVPPLGLALALAVAEVADAHPDALPGLLGHPDEDPRAAELVRALFRLGREASSDQEATDE